MAECTSQGQFDLKMGESLKKEGMDLAAANRSSALKYAKSVARKLAMENSDRTCDADQVQRIMIDENIFLGPAAGKLFVGGGEWEWTGDFKKSARKTNHARIIRIWRLK